jgi:hypothetical protein
MSGFRRFFWNYKKSFIGLQFATTAPLQAAKLIVPIVLPIQLLLILQKGSRC